MLSPVAWVDLGGGGFVETDVAGEIQEIGSFRTLPLVVSPLTMKDEC